MLGGLSMERIALQKLTDWNSSKRFYIFAAEQSNIIMYSNEDLERFYFKYQSEALPHGQSLQSFCLNNHVPYNLFSKWYKDTRRKIVAVQVDDRPLE